MGWLSDIGNAVGSAVGAVGDVVEGAVDTVADVAGDIVDSVADGVGTVLSLGNDWLCENTGNVGCRFGNVVLGGLGGVVDGVRDLANAVLDTVSDVGGFVGAVLRGDFAGALAKLLEIGLDVVAALLQLGRVLLFLTAIDGARDAWEAESLRRFVEDLLEDRFGSDPERLRRIRDHLSLDEGSRWGLPLQVTHRVMCLDSELLPLHEWHARGTIDLYALAGVASFDSFQVFRQRTAVHVMSRDGIESSIPANRWQIAKYLESQGKDYRLRVYALTRGAIKELAQNAIVKCRQIGVRLEVNEGNRWSQLDLRRAAHLVTTDDGGDPPGSGTPFGLSFDRARLGRFLVQKGYRTGAAHEECEVPAFAAFAISDGGRGQASGRDIAQGSAGTPCSAQPDRNDHCCVRVTSTTGTNGSGVVYREAWPPIVTKYVLAHEIGHYLGLCHFGHDGIQNIMFTTPDADPDADISWFDWGELDYLLDGEPNFTLDDGKNAWRFIVSELSQCLEPEAGPIIL
jgi:hypothetical protein